MEITADIARMYKGYANEYNLMDHYIEKINSQIELDAKSGFDFSYFEMNERMSVIRNVFIQYYTKRGFAVNTYYDDIKKCEFLKISWE